METETYLTLTMRLNYLKGEEVRSALELVTNSARWITILRTRLAEG